MISSIYLSIEYFFFNNITSYSELIKKWFYCISNFHFFRILQPFCFDIPILPLWYYYLEISIDPEIKWTFDHLNHHPFIPNIITWCSILWSFVHSFLLRLKKVLSKTSPNGEMIINAALILLLLPSWSLYIILSLIQLLLQTWYTSFPY